MEMVKKLILLFFVMACAVTGCSGRNGTPNPMLPDLDSSPGVSYSSSHLLWGIYGVSIQPTGSDTANIEIIPLRGPAFNSNIQRFLSPPSSPVHLLTLGILPGTDFSTGYVNLNVAITHPFPGLMKFHGFDVRCIFMADASTVGLYDSDILYNQVPPDGGPAEGAYLLNPDGYTRWWNAVEFTDPLPLFSYKPGPLGTDPYPEATLNPYKYFADDLGPSENVADLPVDNRGSFTPSMTPNHRRFTIQFPVDGAPSFKFNYAIDASYDVPDPSYEPEYPVESFPSSAQTQEAYHVDAVDAGTDAYFVGGESGGNVRLDIEIFDWQAILNPDGVEGEVSAIRLEGYPLAGPVNVLPLASVSTGSVETSLIFNVNLDESYLDLDQSGDFNLLGTVESTEPDSYCPQIENGDSFIYPEGAVLAAYFMVEVTVSDEISDQLTLITPNGGEVWTVGSSQEIMWEGGTYIENVKLEFSDDDFTFNISVIAASLNDGTHTWNPVPDYVSDTLKVRVSDLVNPSVFDDSDDYFSIVGEAGEPVLIATLLGFNSPYCVKIDTQNNEAWVDCTQSSPVLDFGFYRIDDEELVEKVFEKTPTGGPFGGMPGNFGLNVEARLIISADMFSYLAPTPVDVWHIDDITEEKFYIPMENGYDPIYLGGDGELFKDLSVAAVTDTATKPNGRLVVWDYTESSPVYTTYWTEELPSIIEADYAGHRLFVYCRGDFGGPGPTVQVWDASDWTVITSFLTEVGGYPFMSDIDFDPATNRLYFGSGSSGQFEVWDVEIYEHVQTVSTGYGEVSGLDHMGDRIYVVVPDHLLVYDAVTFVQLFDVYCGPKPQSVGCNPNTGKIYVPENDLQAVLVYIV